MAKVFISYRREDSEWQAHEIYAAILRTSGSNKADVFIDVDAVPLGVNFKDYIDAKVAEADVGHPVAGFIGRKTAEEIRGFVSDQAARMVRD